MTEVLTTDLSFSQLIKEIDRLAPELKDARTIKIGISSNITANSAEYFFKKHCFLRKINAQVVFGDYDSHYTNADKFAGAGCDIVVFQNFLDNISPNFESNYQSMSEGAFNSLAGKIENELRLCLERVRGCKSVFVDAFYSAFRSEALFVDSALDALIAKLNSLLGRVASEFPNARLIDPGIIVDKIGEEEALSFKHYFQFKSPYKTKFWDHYTRQLLIGTRFAQSYFYKVLVLDCDNTLWGGIVGEDGPDGIKLNPFDYPGNIFWRIQHELVEIQNQGILLCLCSKNNPEDVEKVLTDHPHQVLNNQHIILKKVNWQSKVENIQQIAKDLNLGLDSFIFVDDSDFEINSVRDVLPQVTTFQVPKSLSEYPLVLRQIRDLVIAGGVSKESLEKTQQYRQMIQTMEEKAKHGSFDEYLRSLHVKVDIKRNPKESIKRIAELTQKSNQFNLTTRRYTEADITKFMEHNDWNVFSINVSDKFGDSGLTGVLIANTASGEVEIDSFLMSCRVLGRSVEYSLWRPVLTYLKSKGFPKVKASFKPTQKNAQVTNFYDDLGLTPGAQETDGSVSYFADIDEVVAKIPKHAIEVLSDF